MHRPDPVGEVGLEDERDLRLDARLQDRVAGNVGDVGVRHVGEQDAEVRLVDAELRLHGRGREADLAANHGRAGGKAGFGVAVLHRVRGLQVVRADEVTHRRARLLRRRRVKQAGGRLSDAVESGSGLGHVIHREAPLLSSYSQVLVTGTAEPRATWPTH